MKDVDAHDEDDSASTEIVVAASVAAVLAHPPNMREMTAARVESILDSVVGVTLRFYAQRVLQLFIGGWRTGVPVMEDDYRVLTESVERGVRNAVDQTGETVREIIKANSGPITIEDGLMHEAVAYGRLVDGLESASRILVTRTREEAKFDFATKQGAVGKAWRTRRDGRVRVTHADLEGDFVLLDEAFTTVAGNRVRWPGDPKAPLQETINCRCRLSYRMPLVIPEAA